MVLNPLQTFPSFPVNSPHTWGALQTFGAGIQLGAGQAIKDSGGAAQITVKATSPQLTFENDARVDGKFSVGGAIGSLDRVTIFGDAAPTTHHIVLNIGGAGFMSPTTAGKNYDLVRARNTLRTSQNIAILTGINFSPLLQNVLATDKTVTSYFPISATVRTSAAGAGALKPTNVAAVYVGPAEKTANVIADAQYGLWIRDQTLSVTNADGSRKFYGIRVDEYTEVRNAAGSEAFAAYLVAPSGSGGSTLNYGIAQIGTGDPTQVAVNYLQAHTLIGAAARPVASAVLELQSTTGALLLPRMTTTQRDALTAVNGMIIYNTTTGVVEAYEAGAWVNA